MKQKQQLTIGRIGHKRDQGFLQLTTEQLYQILKLSSLCLALFKQPKFILYSVRWSSALYSELCIWVKQMQSPSAGWGPPCPPLMHCRLRFRAVPCRTSHQQLLMVSPNAWVLARNSGSTDVNSNCCCWIYWIWICPIKGQISQTEHIPLCTKFSTEKVCIFYAFSVGEGVFTLIPLQSLWWKKLTYAITAVCPFV